MRHEEREEDERANGVDVHRELEGRETEACEDGEKTIEAGEFVEYHRQRNHLCPCSQAHEVEECLWHC